MSGTAHISLQNPLFRKYQNICNKMLWRPKRHYWINAAANRYLKKSDSVADDLTLLLKIYQTTYLADLKS